MRRLKPGSVPRYNNDASCIGNKRGMARRAKRHSHHAERQALDKEMRDDARQDVQSGPQSNNGGNQEPQYQT